MTLVLNGTRRKSSEDVQLQDLSDAHPGLQVSLITDRRRVGVFTLQISLCWLQPQTLGGALKCLAERVSKDLLLTEKHLRG